MILRVDNFLLTTEEAPRGLLVKRRLGVAYSSIVATTGFVKDFMAGLRDVFSSGWKGYQKEVENAIVACLEDLVRQTESQGGNALIGVRIAVRPMFTEKTKMFFVSVQGTACEVVEDDHAGRD